MSFKAAFPPPKTKITTITGANYTVLDTDFLVLVDVSGASRTITLPVASGRSGVQFKIKRIDQTLSFSVDIIVASSGTIDGQTTRRLNTQYDELEVVSDGSTWQVLSRYIKNESIAYTPPIFTGFGTPTSVNVVWNRVGNRIHVQGSFLSGTPTANQAQIGLPSGLTISSTLVTSLQVVGSGTFAVAAAGSMTILGTGGDAYVTIGLQTAANAGITPVNANTFISSAQKVPFFFSVPITNWEG